MRAVPGRGVAVALLAVGLAAGGCGVQWGPPLAPDFALEDTRGRTVTLSELRGKVVLLVFWASWAPPCRLSVPHMIRLKHEYGGEEFTLLAVTVEDSPKAVAMFLDRVRVNFTILHGTQEVAEEYFGDSQVKLPTYVLVDGRGRDVARVVGYHGVDDLRPAIEDAIAGLKHQGRE